MNSLFKRAVGSALVLLTVAYVAVGPAAAEQTGTPEVRISFDGSISPRVLPRLDPAPVFLSLRGGVRSSGGAPPPHLGRIELAFGARGGLDTVGLPVCPRARLRNATARQALARCGGARVGHGRISTEVPLDPADPLIAPAALLAFNGRTGCPRSRTAAPEGLNQPPHARTRERAFASGSGGHAALIQNQPFLNPQSQSDSPWGLRKGPATLAQGAQKRPATPAQGSQKGPANHAPGPQLRSPSLAGRPWPSRSRTQGGRQGERTPVRDPQAADRGRRDAQCQGRPAVWVHAYSASPPVSFVLPFYLRRLQTGAYGVLMRSPVRRALGRWPRLRSFEISLGRRYRAGGEPHSYLNARCPLPPRFSVLSVPVARATYHFAPRPTLTQPILRRCRVREAIR